MPKIIAKRLRVRRDKNSPWGDIPAAVVRETRGAETDPTVPDWAKQPEKPKYTAAEVGAAEIEVTDEEINVVTVSGTASVGQTIVVDEIDEDGYPVSWHAVDLPAGGGASVKIDDTLTQTGAAADAAKVGEKLGEIGKHVAELGNKVDGVKTWDYTEGLPEVDGYTYVGTAGKAVLKDNGVELSAGAEYHFPFANASESTIEFKFTITKKSSSYWGFVVVVSNGTKGIRLSMQNGEVYFCQNTSNNLKRADISENVEHTLKVDFFDTGKADVYLDDNRIITNDISVPQYRTTLFQQHGSGTTLIHSITYNIPDVKGDYIPVPETAAVGQTIVVESVDENGKPTAWKAEDLPSETGGGTDISLGVSGAVVGQIAKVSAVDASGKPTMWLPADFPSGGGGGGSGAFEELFRLTTTEEVGKIETGVDLRQYSEIIAYCNTIPVDGTAATTHFDWYFTKKFANRINNSLHNTQKRVQFARVTRINEKKLYCVFGYGAGHVNLFKENIELSSADNTCVFTGANMYLSYILDNVNDNFALGSYGSNTMLKIGTQVIVYGRR